jgi:hypothetical protein
MVLCETLTPLRSHSSSNISRLAWVTRTRPILSRLKNSPLSSAVDVIEIVYDIYAIPISGPPRDAYSEGGGACCTIGRFRNRLTT